MKRNVQISIDIQELQVFDDIVGKGNRSPEIEKLVRKFNQSFPGKTHGKSEVIEEQLKLEE